MDEKREELTPEEGREGREGRGEPIDQTWRPEAKFRGGFTLGRGLSFGLTFTTDPTRPDDEPLQ